MKIRVLLGLSLTLLPYSLALAQNNTAGNSPASNNSGDDPIGWYVTGSAGAYLPLDRQGQQIVTVTGPTGFATGTVKETATYNNGAIGLLAIGRSIGSNVRVEFEFDYSQKSLDQITVKPGVYNFTPINNTAPFSGLISQQVATYSSADIDQYGFIPAIYYDLHSHLPIQPYLGLGVGVEISDGSEQKGYSYFSATPTIRTPVNARGGTYLIGVGFVEAGFTYKIFDNLAIGPSYRFEQSFLAPGKADQPEASIAKIDLRYNLD